MKLPNLILVDYIETEYVNLRENIECICAQFCVIDSKLNSLTIDFGGKTAIELCRRPPFVNCLLEIKYVLLRDKTIIFLNFFSIIKINKSYVIAIF